MKLPAHLELTPAWTAIRAELRLVVGETTFEMWLSGLEARAWDGHVLIIDGPESSRAWVTKRFGRVLERAVRTVIGDEARVSFGPDEHTAAGGNGGRRGTGGGRAGRGGNGHGNGGDDALPGAPIPAGQPLNERYTFDQFVIGDGNRLAHAAALAVAEVPGHTYNPLFLQARPGLGKTHLLHAIGNYVRDFGAGATVRYATIETFTNDFLAALHTKTTAAFKRAYRETDVLLIDDVQSLASKVRTEEEFFHTFTALYESGRQLVLTCDRPPHQLAGIEPRLRERFGSGLVAEIAPPDLATRITILRKRAALDRVPVADPAVFELIATRITDNIRALEAALIRLVAHCSLTGRTVDLELASLVVSELAPPVPAVAPSSAQVTVERVQATVATYFDIPVDEILSQRRTGRIAWARQIAIHLSRELTPASLSELGAAFGGRNHATVLHSCKRVAERILASPEAAHDVDNIRQQLSPPRVDHSS